MPLHFRSIAGLQEFASYSFPNDNTSSSREEAFPWLLGSGLKVQDVDTSLLCRNCQRLDISFLFEHLLGECVVRQANQGGHHRPTTLLDGINLGPMQKLRANINCVFCRLVCTALDQRHPEGCIPDVYEGNTVECFLSNIRRGPEKLDFLSDRKNLSRVGDIIELSVRTQPLVLGPRLDPEDRVTIQPATIRRLGDEQQYEQMHAVVVPRRIYRLMDYVLLSKWVSRCEKADAPVHGYSGSTGYARETSEKRSSFKIRLVDVERGYLVGPLLPSRYVALSYVWGGTKQNMLTSKNLETLQQEGSISPDDARYPRTIREAIRLCREMKEQFLWIDSMCIIQDNNEDKAEQIRIMDCVYQQACFTIVAAAGTDADASLPGTSPRNPRQCVVEVQGLTLASALTNFAHGVNESVWNTRGWTYQERVLSRRKIIFTNEQIYFECGHGECSEDLYIDVHAVHQHFSDPMIGDDTPYQIQKDRKLNLLVYCSIVQSYTQRELTFPDDIVNAFEGIARILSKDLFDNGPIVYGIPLCIYTLALLWHPAGRLKRLDSLPSWSWVGWMGETHHPSLWNMSERTISCIELVISGSDGDAIEWHSLRPGQTAMPPPSWTEWPEWDRCIDDSDMVRYVRKRGDPNRWYCHPIDAVTLPFPASPGSVPLSLGLTTEVAMLTVSHQHSELWSTDYRCQEGNHIVCQLSVFDSVGLRAGIVVVDGNTYASLIPGRHAFVKLSQTTLAPGRDDPAWDSKTRRFTGRPGDPAINPQPALAQDDEMFDPSRYDHNVCWCLYNVLMVRWHDNVAYRIGVGRVHIHAFDEAGAERRTIQLG